MCHLPGTVRRLVSTARQRDQVLPTHRLLGSVLSMISTVRRAMARSRHLQSWLL